MKRVFGGTLILALASLVSFAQQTPPAAGAQPDPTTSTQQGAKRGAGKHAHNKGKNRGKAGGRHSKAASTDSNSAQPAK